jgi:hypothetical protein
MIQRTIASDVAFGGRPEPQRTKLLGFKPFVRSTLRGFVDVELGIGLQIKGATLHVTSGKSWIGLPSRPMVGPDGKPIVIEATGKPPCQPILGWRYKALSEALSNAVAKLILEQHPDAFDGGDQ